MWSDKGRLKSPICFSVLQLKVMYAGKIIFSLSVVSASRCVVLLREKVLLKLLGLLITSQLHCCSWELVSDIFIVLLLLNAGSLDSPLAQSFS